MSESQKPVNEVVLSSSESSQNLNSDKMQNIGSDETMTMRDLPDELVQDILTRLPGKSLCRFRCMSQSWARVITPEFVNSVTEASNPRQRMKLFIFSEKQSFTLDCYKTTTADANEGDDGSSSSSSNKYPTTMERLELPFKIVSPLHFENARLPLLSYLASADSWLMLTLSKRITLFNPSTKEWRPQAHMHHSCLKVHLHVLGIYYDSSDQDYKSVKVVRCFQSRRPWLEVYSLRTNTPVKDMHLPFHDNICSALSKAVLLNKALHWISESQKCILRFHLEEETLVELQFPRINADFSGLAAMRGNLCAYHVQGNAFRVWEMKEYMVDASWFVVCTIIASPESSISCEWLKKLKPLSFTKKDEVILSRASSELYIYDPKDRTCKSLVKFDNDTIITPYFDL